MDITYLQWTALQVCYLLLNLIRDFGATLRKLHFQFASKYLWTFCLSSTLFQTIRTTEYSDWRRVFHKLKAYKGFVWVQDAVEEITINRLAGRHSLDARTQSGREEAASPQVDLFVA